MMRPKILEHGFTLIELSIVLVIVGLIVGGVLVGQDLIRSGAVRAQITQLEKYQGATNTFRGKYGALPGDLNAATASQYGFAPRVACRGGAACTGGGNGDGVINGGGNESSYPYEGEAEMFWVDLSQAGLIEGGFTIYNLDQSNEPAMAAIPGILGQYMPEAKLGGGNFIGVWCCGWNNVWNPTSDNFFDIAAYTTVPGSMAGAIAYPAMTVQQAYSIDKKLDDGLPQSGRVMAMYADWINGANINGVWAINGSISAGRHGSVNQSFGDSDPATFGPVVAGDGVATTGSATTCYDNGGAGGATEQYSIGQNNGAGVNCALSFQFQ
jgi:prepilin-type N-terminal cleavage/methylation domain-containing protein